ncbi:hypothetical protein ACFTWS_38425 [Streptomyces sp. NPDC057027]
MSETARPSIPVVVPGLWIVIGPSEIWLPRILVPLTITTFAIWA